MINKIEIEVLTPAGKQPLHRAEEKFKISIGECRGKPAIVILGNKNAYLGLELDRIAEIVPARERYGDDARGIIVETKDGGYYHIHNGTSRVTDLRLQMMRQLLRPGIWLRSYT